MRIFIITSILIGTIFISIGLASPQQWENAKRLNIVNSKLASERAEIDSLNNVISRLRSFKNIKREALRHGYKPRGHKFLQIPGGPGHLSGNRLRGSNSVLSR